MRFYAAELGIVGKVRGVVDSVFAFEDVQKGYERIMSGRAMGKVVVKIDPSVE
jgi:NADPH:quinone reductase-like Zn-dependent oxidoreductase